MGEETIFARTNREFLAYITVITKQPASHYVKTSNDCFNKLGACYINNTLIYPLSDSVCVYVCVCACACMRVRMYTCKRLTYENSSYRVGDRTRSRNRVLKSMYID